MKIDIKPGKYVLATSGGVDSMVLLELLGKRPGVELVVAHFNHGIRSDSGLDEKLVVAAARSKDLELEVGHGRLGEGTSEAAARSARYEFVESVRLKHGARSTITAHHQDDLIETVILNVLRGSGRRGVSAISQNPKILRPLLAYSKRDIVRYAQKNKTIWREDSTNRDEVYLRNYIRGNITPKLNNTQRAQFLKNADKVAKTGLKIDQIIATLSRSINNKGKINRYEFSALPNEIGLELAMAWLRDIGVRQFDKNSIEKFSMTLKTAKAGTNYTIIKGVELAVEERIAYLRII